MGASCLENTIRIARAKTSKQYLENAKDYVFDPDSVQVRDNGFVFAVFV